MKTVSNTQKLDKVFIIGEGPRTFAETISDNITVLPLTNANDLAEKITKLKPNAVLWGSDSLSKKLSAQVAAKLNLGLCADCTLLETNGEDLYMYRPALSGSVIAKIVSRTKPAMATVRTAQNGADIMVAAGYGAKLEVVDMAFDSLIPALASDAIDFIAAGMSVTEERKKNVDFSDPYYESKQVVIIRK